MRAPSLLDIALTPSEGRACFVAMKVHVVWSRREQRGLRRIAGLCEYLSPDGSQVLYVGLETQRFSVRPGAAVGSKPRLERYLEEQAISETELEVLSGELHLPGGQHLDDRLLQRTVEVLLLSEEPPGNDIPGEEVELPGETFYVISQGTSWPGYDKVSLEPDGDVIVNHVLMGSVVPPAPPA
jgi:hypothetical protein